MDPVRRPDIRPVASFDVIITGRGLAGTVLSETLQERGLRVRVFDMPRTGRSSHVAGGLVNPIVLRRAQPSWRASTMLAIAGAFIASWSSATTSASGTR